MLLLIDVGNSNIVFCLYDVANNKISAKYRVDTYNKKNILKILYNICNTYIILNDIIISSVVLKINQFLTLNINYFFKDSIIHFFSNNNINVFIKTLYDNNIGMDRILNCIGAVNKFPKMDLLIIDIGTMITFDFITNKKIHLGGVIFPGINSIIKTIYKNSDKLKKNKFILNCKKNITNLSCLQVKTTDNIDVGAYNGCYGAIKQIIENISYNFKKKIFIIGTGGNAFLFKEKNIFNIIDNNLIFFGLLEFYKKYVQ